MDHVASADKGNVVVGCLMGLACQIAFILIGIFGLFGQYHCAAGWLGDDPMDCVDPDDSSRESQWPSCDSARHDHHGMHWAAVEFSMRCEVHSAGLGAEDGGLI